MLLIFISSIVTAFIAAKEFGYNFFVALLLSAVVFQVIIVICHIIELFIMAIIGGIGNYIMDLWDKIRGKKEDEN